MGQGQSREPVLCGGILACGYSSALADAHPFFLLMTSRWLSLDKAGEG